MDENSETIRENTRENANAGSGGVTINNVINKNSNNKNSGSLIFAIVAIVAIIVFAIVAIVGLTISFMSMLQHKDIPSVSIVDETGAESENIAVILNEKCANPSHWAEFFIELSSDDPNVFRLEDCIRNIEYYLYESENDDKKIEGVFICCETNLLENGSRVIGVKINPLEFQNILGDGNEYRFKCVLNLTSGAQSVDITISKDAAFTDRDSVITINDKSFYYFKDADDNVNYFYAPEALENEIDLFMANAPSGYEFCEWIINGKSIDKGVNLLNFFDGTDMDVAARYCAQLKLHCNFNGKDSVFVSQDYALYYNEELDSEKTDALLRIDFPTFSTYHTARNCGWAAVGWCDEKWNAIDDIVSYLKTTPDLYLCLKKTVTIAIPDVFLSTDNSGKNTPFGIEYTNKDILQYEEPYFSESELHFSPSQSVTFLSTSGLSFAGFYEYDEHFNFNRVEDEDVKQKILREQNTLYAGIGVQVTIHDPLNDPNDTGETIAQVYGATWNLPPEPTDFTEEHVFKGWILDDLQINVNDKSYCSRISDVFARWSGMTISLYKCLNDEGETPVTLELFYGEELPAPDVLLEKFGLQSDGIINDIWAFSGFYIGQDGKSTWEEQFCTNEGNMCAGTEQYFDGDRKCIGSGSLTICARWYGTIELDYGADNVWLENYQSIEIYYDQTDDFADLKPSGTLWNNETFETVLKHLGFCFDKESGGGNFWLYLDEGYSEPIRSGQTLPLDVDTIYCRADKYVRVGLMAIRQGDYKFTTFYSNLDNEADVIRESELKKTENFIPPEDYGAGEFYGWGLDSALEKKTFDHTLKSDNDIPSRCDMYYLRDEDAFVCDATSSLRNLIRITATGNGTGYFDIGRVYAIYNANNVAKITLNFLDSPDAQLRGIEKPLIGNYEFEYYSANNLWKIDNTEYIQTTRELYYCTKGRQLPSFVLEEANAPVRYGYNFAGYYTERNGEGEQWLDSKMQPVGDIICPTDLSEMELYPKWEFVNPLLEISDDYADKLTCRYWHRNSGKYCGNEQYEIFVEYDAFVNLLKPNEQRISIDLDEAFVTETFSYGREAEPLSGMSDGVKLFTGEESHIDFIETDYSVADEKEYFFSQEFRDINNRQGITLSFNKEALIKYFVNNLKQWIATVKLSLLSKREDGTQPEISLSFAVDFTLPVLVGPDQYVLFGTYPQSRVYDENLIANLTEFAGDDLPKNVVQSFLWKSYCYYKKGAQAHFMWYRDIIYHGEKYREVYFNAYRPYATNYNASTDLNYTFQDNNGYYPGNVYWFKWEPIKWKILAQNQYDDSAMLISDMVLDSQQYYHEKGGTRTIDGKTVYPSNYKESDIRKWLNGEFAVAAFNSKQKNDVIIPTLVDNENSRLNSKEYFCENTEDRIFLLSYDDVCYGSKYGMDTDSSRHKNTTDYALCQGARIRMNNWSQWWLRTPCGKTELYAIDPCVYFPEIASIGLSDSTEIYVTFVYNTYMGVVPAMWAKMGRTVYT